MAADQDRFLGRDVFSYTQEKERFQKGLLQFYAGRGYVMGILSSLCSDFLALCVLYIFQLFVGLSPILYLLEFHHSLFCYHLVILSNHLASIPDYMQ